MRLSPSGGSAAAHVGVIVVNSALESVMDHGNPSPPVGPMPQHDRMGNSWDVFSQLLRTKQWEADANQLRRPVDVQDIRSWLS